MICNGILCIDLDPVEQQTYLQMPPLTGLLSRTLGCCMSDSVMSGAVVCCCLAAVAAIGYVFTRKHLAGAHIQGEEDFQDEIPPPRTDEHQLEAVESVTRTPYSGTPPVSPKEAPERTAWYCFFPSCSFFGVVVVVGDMPRQSTMHACC